MISRGEIVRWGMVAAVLWLAAWVTGGLGVITSLAAGLGDAARDWFAGVQRITPRRYP